jgi:uncharacterized protein YukJ
LGGVLIQRRNEYVPAVFAAFAGHLYVRTSE